MITQQAPPVLLLSLTQLGRIERAALVAWPRECCGLLVGRPASGGWQVLDVAPSANLAPADRPDRFEIDPALALRLQRELRGTDRRLIGLYHSHPDGIAEPSAADRALAWQPDMVWLIIAVRRERIDGLGAYWRPGDVLPASFERMMVTMEGGPER